jgi:hypothetical protein
MSSKVGRDKIWTAVNTACEENIACQFGHACHKFVNPDLGSTQLLNDGQFLSDYTAHHPRC